MEKLSARRDALHGSMTRSFSIKLRLELLAHGTTGAAVTGREEASNRSIHRHFQPGDLNSDYSMASKHQGEERSASIREVQEFNVQSSKFNVQGPKRVKTLNPEH